MEKIELKYGSRTLKLDKSDNLIAVKPRPGREGQLATEMGPRIRPSNGEGASLGGFRIIDVSAADQDADVTLDAVRHNPSVSVGSHVFFTSDDKVPFVPTGQLYVEFKPEAPLDECHQLLAKHHLQVIEARGERELIVQVTAGSKNPVKTAAELQESPHVATAEPDLATPGTLKGFVVPGDSMLKEQWHLENLGTHRGTSLGFRKGADSRAVAAWKLAKTTGAPDVIVAVIDDGFDLEHPDLAGEWKIVAPRDFTRNSGRPEPDFDTRDWHGTACAGVAVGNADGTGVLGAAPGARLMPVRWGRDLSDREIEAWFGYVRDQGAAVVSCSWGALASYFPLSTRAHKALHRCATEGRGGRGSVICFAAGNSNHDIDAPPQSLDGFAIHPDVIAVAASTSMDERSDYSNFGAAIAVCAPSSGAGGWGVTTSDVRGEYAVGGQSVHAGYSPGDYTHEFGGTSSACPLVAGICALVLSVRPELTPPEVKDLLIRTARKIGPEDGYDSRGHSIYFGYGCVDAEAALRAVAGDADEDTGKGEPKWADTVSRRGRVLA